MRATIAAWILSASGAWLAGAGHAREAEQEPEPVHAPEQGDAMRQEIIQLFHRIEQRLAEIDALLYNAGGGAKLAGQAESGIAQLLESSRGKSQEVIEGIDKLLELAQQQQQQQQQQQPGGQQQGQQQGQGSPLDRPQQGEMDREQTPDRPAPQDEPKTQQPQGNEPKGNQDSPQPGRNREGEGAPPSPVGGPQDRDGNERWGDLPIRYRDLFRMEGGNDLPPRYRDWIDAYHRRLNQKP